MTPDEIIALIINNPSAALSVIETLKSTGSLSAVVLKKFSEKFKEIQNNKRFGFSPSADLAKRLYKIDKTPDFIKLKKLIGKHYTLRLVRIGLYLESLNEEGAHELVKNIREEIALNEDVRSLKLVSMGSSGILSEVIGILEELSTQYGWSQRELVEEYEYILRTYDDIVLFVSSEVPKDNIKIRINNLMGKFPKIFFVVAAGSAAKHSMVAVAEMNNDNSIRNRGYTFFPPKKKVSSSRREQFTWSFYKFL